MQRLTLVGVEMWTENVFVTRPGHSVSPFWNFFQGLRGLPCLQLPQACQNQHYRTKPSWDFLADSDATFDIGGNWNVDWKWSSWVGQAMQFPRFEGFFFQDAGGLPCPQLPQACQNQHYRTKTLKFPSGFRRNVWHWWELKCGLKMVLVSRPGQGARGLPCPQLPQACQNQHYRTKTF